MVTLVEDIIKRRKYTQERLDSLKESLKDAESRCAGKACVYATGSFARGEAHPWSDLDLFIVGRSSNGKRDLPRLEEIRIKADLIDATEKQKIPEFSGDGRYLDHCTVEDLIGTLGKPEDDALNTFTARLLLLLESKPLLEQGIYQSVIDEVLLAYWREYTDHKRDFMPAFLANDILRLWRTFCVNYEVRTRREPTLEKAKRKLKNYKLKCSRLLTCYSAILYLLGTHSVAGTVTPDDAKHMVSLTPTQRLEHLAKEGPSSARDGMIQLLDAYERFLIATNRPEKELIELFSNSGHSAKFISEASDFGNLVYTVFELTGGESLFHRLLVV